MWKYQISSQRAFFVFVNMRCPRCNNEDPKYFAYDKGIWYCRRCIVFSRVNVGDRIHPAVLSHRVWKGKPELEYELTPHQKKVSDRALSELKKGKDVFVYASTGAGKTEITFQSICAYLSKGKKVAFAISRRQVVLEIAERLKKAFPELKVVPVAQDYTEDTDGDIIVCTMHQLYRYPFAFDLLILDEVDAFPFAGNELLEQIVELSSIGQKMYLSATPDEKNMAEIEAGKMVLVELFERPHGKDLIVPKVIPLPVFFQVLIVLIGCIYWKRKKKQVLVFVPRKEDSMWLYYLLRIFVKCRAIHSESRYRDETMSEFRNHKLDVLITTTLLERGITIGSVQVIVYQADHSVFTTASLIQIFGRIGRTFRDPYGIGLALCRSRSASLNQCINQLERMNDKKNEIQN